MTIANSSAQPNLVRVRYLGEGGASTDHDVWVPAGGRATVGADQTLAVPSGSFGYHVFSLSGIPMVAERSMYFGAGWPVGTSGVGAPSPATTWYFAEGSTGFYDTFILLANTSAQAASVRLRFQLTGGGFVERDTTVPASGRHTFYVNAEGGLPVGAAFSTRVMSVNGVPVVAERAMYWAGGNWFGAHVTLGSR